ncbi:MULTISPECIES: SGNH/GDSL hydrolase family protein [Kitasatospora]|uniref:Putative esterase n=1 Tax=Kitasatospora setae (strain ATCC 33774 / DSM 43861 / JCM 3304 / KCC A-0304 / NBRC 14216 / KM-6054) TaxID=452652 RepID=E4NIK0_KITSK|nr:MULTISPECIES: SGNH/GDSL hydrolase family protein [Kitasatospora]BAJ32798.1 putative esterase [Kitasatospora setae KM-6054]
MPTATRKTTTAALRRAVVAAVTAVVLGSCPALAAPAAGAGPNRAPAGPGPAEPVPTVFFGDSLAAGFGIAPVSPDGDGPFCFRAVANYPAVATRLLAERGVPLDVRADVSCSGAAVHDFWTPQPLAADRRAAPQQDALAPDTRLLVGSVGGNTLSFGRVLKQCSATLRAGSLMPGDPVDPDQPAADCREFFEEGAGREWLEGRFVQVEAELTELLVRARLAAPGVRTVLVGYSRMVPADPAACLTPAPGQDALPFADIPPDALPFIDRVQRRLDDLTRRVAEAGGAAYVDLYDRTGDSTACAGPDRGVGGLLEDSELGPDGRRIPWYVHPNERGRDLQAEQVAAAVEPLLGRAAR